MKAIRAPKDTEVISVRKQGVHCSDGLVLDQRECDDAMETYERK